MNITLLAYYGIKPSPLHKFIRDVQKTLHKALPGAFEAYGQLLSLYDDPAAGSKPHLS